MKIEVFLFLLLTVSIFTGLTVEALKKLLGENNKYSSNILACVVSIVLSVIIGVFYCILTGVIFNPVIIICIVALVFLSWLCAMVGYDKVIQAITQIRTTKQ